MDSVGFLLVMIMLMATFYDVLGCIGGIQSIASSSCGCHGRNRQPVKAGYWPSSANSYMAPWNVNASLYTHLFYAFAYLDEETFTVTVAPEDEQILEGFSVTVQEINSSVKTLISIGGGESNATVYSIMAANSTHRKSFIDSSIALARQHEFHGLDLDWVFPENSADMINLGLLLAQWRERVHEESMATGLDPLLLTAGVYFSEQFFDGEIRGYPIQAMADNLDWINVMCFDYHGPWDTNQTGSHAALYDQRSHLSTSYGIGSWLDAGIPDYKVVMGMPMYGRSWLLRNKKKVKIGAPAVAAGPRQKLSHQAGFMMFSEIQDFIVKSNATVVVDNATVSAYCYGGDVWIGYDNEETVSMKTMFAKDRGLLGYFFWAVSYDHNWTLSNQASKTWDEYCEYGGEINHGGMGAVSSPAPAPSPSTHRLPGPSAGDVAPVSGKARDSLSSLHTHHLVLLASIILVFV